jgi:hypothetical protein
MSDPLRERVVGAIGTSTRSRARSALSDVTSATQQARALARDIAVVLDAANEVRGR